MRVRTFFMFLLLLGALWAIASIWTANEEILRHPIKLWGDTSTNVGWLLVGFMGVGVLGTVLLGGARELSLVIERSRLRKAGRKYEDIEDEYSRGLVADLEGRDAEALAHFRKVLEWDSRHFNTLIKIGEVLRSQGKHAEAIEYHRKAHHLKEDSTRPLYALVEDYAAKGEMDQARVVLGKIIAVNKNSVAAWRKLRSVHMKDGNWEEALAAHERVAKLSWPEDPQVPHDQRTGLGIRYEIASERLREGKPREAIAMLRRLVKEHPSFIPAYVKLGVVQRIRDHRLADFPHRARGALPEARAADGRDRGVEALHRGEPQGHAAPVLPGEALFPARDARRRVRRAVLARGAGELRADAALPARPDPRAAQGSREGERGIPAGDQGDRPRPARVPLPGLRPDRYGMDGPLRGLRRMADDRGQLSRGDLARRARAFAGPDLHEPHLR
jgi:tetratricopeptide (TPR) repeat protein